MMMFIKLEGFLAGIAHSKDLNACSFHNSFQGRANQFVIINNNNCHFFTSFGMDTNNLKPDAVSMLKIPCRLSIRVLMLFKPMPFSKSYSFSVPLSEMIT